LIILIIALLSLLFEMSSISLLLKSFIDSLSRHITLFFHIASIFALEFMHLKTSHWLEVLITCSLSIEIVSMFNQFSVVAGLRCYFSPPNWGVWVSS
jgi:hypothetical protein